MGGNTPHVAPSDHVPMGWAWLPTDNEGRPRRGPRPVVITPKMQAWLDAYIRKAEEQAMEWRRLRSYDWQSSVRMQQAAE